jgi:hypothetical protein
LTSQRLDRRIPDKQTRVDEIAAWEHPRNTHRAKAYWRFTTPDARIKQKRLYPLIRLNRATSRLCSAFPIFHVSRTDVKA